MRKLIIVSAIVLMAGGTTALAQNAIQSPNLTAPPPANATFPEAPIGHRQPRAGDIPSEKNRAENPQDAINREDAALDRKIKGICKGC